MVRLSIALISALALAACDQPAPRPKSAGASTGGAAAGPRSSAASGSETSGVRPAADDATKAGGTSSGTLGIGGASSGGSKPASGTTAAATPGTVAPSPATTPPATPSGESLPDGVLKHTETDSGLIVDDLRFGNGAEVRPLQSVTMHFRGSLADGTVFYVTEVGKTDTFSLTQLIKGCQEGIVGMKVGGKRRLIIPPDLGYGKKGFMPNGKVVVPPNSMLIYEVELFGVQ